MNSDEFRSALKSGDRVYRWVLTGSNRGCDIQDIQPLTVVRVSAKTITVRTDHGSQIRLPPQDIQGRWSDDQ